MFVVFCIKLLQRARRKLRLKYEHDKIDGLNMDGFQIEMQIQSAMMY